MHRLILAVGAALAFLSVTAYAQQPPPPPPYGPPITQEQAMKLAAATQAEAVKLGQNVVIAIVGPAGDLIYFTKMDRAQYGSIDVALKKARTSAAFRRPTKAFEDGLAKGGGGLSILLLPGVIASAGGIPIIIDGKIAGAIGVSGSPMGTIDAQAAQAGLDALK